MDRKKIDLLILEKIEKSLHIIIPIAAAISFLSAYIIYINKPNDPFVIYDSALGFVMLSVFLFRKKINVKVKVFAIALFTLFLGTLSLFNSGFTGTAVILLSMSTLVMVGFMPRMEGILFAITTLLIHALIPALMYFDLHTYSGELSFLMNSPMEWTIHLILYATYCTILLIVINAIKSYLLKTITETEKNRNQIYRLAYHDQLTGLPNKNMFIEQMDALKPKAGWLVLFNIRGLNLINSIYGSDVGDNVIKHIAFALSEASHSDEIVAKTGGNELVWYCRSIDNATLMQRIASFTEEVNKNSEDKAFPANLNLNAGYVLIDSSYEDTIELLQKVSMALEQAKTHKTHKVMSYDSLLEEQFRTDETIKNLLPYAIAEDEITISYQEKRDCDLEKVVGVEALARWSSPVLGNVAPDVFIPILEKANLSVTFGTMIIQKVLDEYPRLVEKYDADITVSINISPSHLASKEFTEFVINEVLNRGIDPNRITLEITEDSLIESLDIVAGVLFKLRNFGFKISLDDFGTGYSSLSYLSRLGFDELKIDRSFINQLNEDSRTGMLIRTIINLKDTYGIDIVAEGVETQVQSDILKDFGCMVHQGYLFSKPMPLI
jgi:diguanylate cyclase (GGDEF)-like protein